MDVFRLQSVCLHLFRNEKFLGDLGLLRFGITGNPDDLHPVLKGRRNGIEGICSGDEENLGKIVVHIQIVIIKGMILLRVEHLEEGRRRIPSKIGAHLVHFIEQKTGLFDPAFLTHWMIFPGRAPT